MSGPTSNLHTHLRAWRKHVGLTLEQTQNIIGAKINTISGWENGKRTVDLDDLKKLADAYGVDPAALLYSPHDEQRAKRLSTLNKAIDRLSEQQIDVILELARQLTTK